MRTLLMALVAFGLVAGAAAGCVERRLIVRSDPPRARVFLDGEPQGETPEQGGLPIPFTHYGTREIVIRLPKWTPVRMVVEVTPPWWQITPFDFVTELLIPWTIVDERVFEAKLEPAPEVAPGAVEALIQRAEERRAQR